MLGNIEWKCTLELGRLKEEAEENENISYANEG
jgi:hypothetical protein